MKITSENSVSKVFPSFSIKTLMSFVNFSLGKSSWILVSFNALSSDAFKLLWKNLKFLFCHWVISAVSGNFSVDKSFFEEIKGSVFWETRIKWIFQTMFPSCNWFSCLSFVYNKLFPIFLVDRSRFFFPIFILCFFSPHTQSLPRCIMKRKYLEDICKNLFSFCFHFRMRCKSLLASDNTKTICVSR